MIRRVILAVALGATLVAEAAAAQELGTPVFKSPYQAFKKSEFNGYFSDPGNGVNLAIEGAYRMARKSFDFGLTAGWIDEDQGDDLFGVGIDGRMAVMKHSEDIPLDGAVTAGFGAIFGNDFTGFTIPMGFSVGRQIELENSKVSFTPYAHPILVPTLGDFNDSFQFALGLGVDIALSPAFEVRVSGALGDYEGVALGVAWHK